ncbi:MAG: FAD:protein FMN transferase, partial [Thermodesulfobacteriota bacterium]
FLSGLILSLYAGPIHALPHEELISGNTMGTAYHIKVVLTGKQNLPDLEKKIEKRLEAINRSMSTFRPESEISRFNRWNQLLEAFPISEDFFQVMTVSRYIYDLTQGAWDGTVKPLVELWGFGKSVEGRSVPEKSRIEEVRNGIGFHHIRILKNKRLLKESQDVTLDLASIAKGYGVDAVSELLRKEGLSRFLVEIGGEVYASGAKADGNPWRVGINYPDPAASLTRVHKIVLLKDMALATSGDYRNFFEIDGIRYSHVIDPKTGWPVSNGVISVSVWAKTCTLADGLATAMMVMGAEKGVALANRLDSVECLIIRRAVKDRFVESYSHGFDQIISR